MLSFLKQRLPANNDIFLVVSTAAFLVFSWSLREFFYNLPAFLLSYSIWNLLSIAAYMMTAALLETAVVVAFVVLIAFLLPGFALKDGFSYKASLLLLATAGISIHLQFVMTNQPRIGFLLLELGRGLGIWLAAVLVVHYVPVIRKIFLDALDRLTIFSYIYFPIGMISLIVVAIRLIW